MDDHRAHLVNLALIAGSAVPRAPQLVVPGPENLVLFGVAIPVFSAIAGSVGVVLGHLMAPAGAPMPLRQRIAVTASMLLLTLTIVIASGQWPLVALAWGLGLGFSGPSVAQTLGAQAVAGVRRISDAFLTMIASKISGKNGDNQDA